MAERGEKRKRKTPLIMIFNICINTTFAYIRLLLYLIGIFWLHFLLFSTLMILVFSLVLLLSFLRGKGPSRNCQCEWVSGSVTKKLRNCNISYFFFRINKELRTGRVFCNFFGGLWKSWWNCWGLGVMLEGDSADTCPGKFPLMLMGGRAEGLACTNPEVRTPIGVNGIFLNCFFLASPGKLHLTKTKWLLKTKNLYNKSWVRLCSAQIVFLLYMSWESDNCCYCVQ